jgi:rhamnogalacturonyl hydrolase YesR
MNRFRKFIAGVFLLASLSAVAQSLPKPKSVLKAMTVANQYFMKKWPDPGIPIVHPDKTRPSHIWTRAVYYEGLMALYRIKSDKNYYNYAVAWGESHLWGLHGGVQTRHADNHCAGQTYLDLYQIDKKEERIRDIKASIDNMVASDKNDDWTWVDALQMAMPVFARLGVMYNDNRYYEKMFQLYDYSKTRQGDKGLYNPEDGLWWRDKDFDPPYTEPNGQDCYWSRGNGWVVAALVRVLDIMPANAPHRDEYQKTYLEMMKALAASQRTDGYWNVSLHDSTNYGGKELTGTALFTYGMAWGVRKGLLDKNSYLPIITKAWNAMATESVHANGFLGYVQGTGKEPKDGQLLSYTKEPNFEDFGLGCFLLAGSEVYRLASPSPSRGGE